MALTIEISSVERGTLIVSASFWRCFGRPSHEAELNMQMDRYTIKAQEALQAAQQTASRSGHPEMGAAHLLTALLAQDGGLVPPVLQKIGVDVTALKLKTIELL